jgi:hypothetical protein
MAGIMLDSISPEAVITAVRERREWRNMVIRAAAGYIDGKFAWPAASFTRLRAHGIATVEITVTGVPGAAGAKVKKIGDVEPGDLDPVSGAEWAAGEVKNSEWPVIYVDRTNKSDVLAQCNSRGIAAPHDFGLIVSTLDGTFTDLNGTDLRKDPAVAGVQFAGADRTGIDADATMLTALGDKWLSLPPSWDSRALALLGELDALLRDNL